MEYRREEITFAPDPIQNIILVFENPSLHEICSQCGQVVGIVKESGFSDPQEDGGEARGLNITEQEKIEHQLRNALASTRFTAELEPNAENEVGKEVDDDIKVYCFCHRPSFGDMIACDEPTCKVEWYHLACIGLAVAPEGVWICDICMNNEAKWNN
ncbi:hypothetical protein GYMLUDRAFT_167361 [Collybiopsis luxurians FD-317 M1]|uniref:PHD-type domain-containing protein n=1 Tax=Collybiopsis luxurians FD-317 M1 TaxID=944289 RepID=A0A0D0BAV9_9AGAR|nr:hypothetical protein GYMLUDRAFT_167361 [Collybiopsis luxurians FD-317 M1]